MHRGACTAMLCCLLIGCARPDWGRLAASVGRGPGREEAPEATPMPIVDPRCGSCSPAEGEEQRELDERAFERLLASDDAYAELRKYAAELGYETYVGGTELRYEDGTVEFVTTGRKLENIRANPRVALAVHKHTSGIPEWSVTLLGTAAIVEDEAETREANGKINEKYGAELDAWEENTLVRVNVGSASLRRY